MSLPEITLPYGLPVFQGSGHAITLRASSADVKFRTGHSRKRRLVTGAPRVVSVGLFLSAAQILAFDNWFENDLVAGERQFSARVANQGPGLLWWAAEWFDVPLCTPLHSGYWRVTGSLLLTGEGSVEGPPNTSAAVEFLAPLLATAVMSFDGSGAVEFGAALGTAALGAVEFGGALVYREPDYLLREDLDFIRREDGSRILRE